MLLRSIFNHETGRHPHCVQKRDVLLAILAVVSESPADDSAVATGLEPNGHATRVEEGAFALLREFALRAAQPLEGSVVGRVDPAASGYKMPWGMWT